MAYLMLPLLAAAGSPVPVAANEAAAQRVPHLAVEAFSPDGRWLAIAGAWLESPGELKLRDLTTGKERQICKNHSDAINAIAFTPDGTLLASGDWRGMVKIWKTATGKPLATLQANTRQVWSLSFSPDGKMLASSSPTAIKLWEVATGKKRAEIKMDGEERSFLGPNAGCVVSFSPDGKTLAFGLDDGKVMLWDVATAKDRAVLNGHAGTVFTAAFASDGKTLATAHSNGSLMLWHVGTGNLKATLCGHKGLPCWVVFSPDNRMLASWSLWRQKIPKGGGMDIVKYGNEVKVWEVATGQARLTFEPEKSDDLGGGLRPRPLQFTQNGNELLTLDPDNTVRPWNLADLAARPK
jgi:WD40 repeat protein